MIINFNFWHGSSFLVRAEYVNFSWFEKNYLRSNYEAALKFEFYMCD